MFQLLEKKSDFEVKDSCGLNITTAGRRDPNKPVSGLSMQLPLLSTPVLCKDKLNYI